MKLNAFLWQNFLESSKGRQWIDFFSDLKALYEHRDHDLRRFIEQWASLGRLGERFSVDEEIDNAMDALGFLNEAVKNNQLPGGPLNSWDEAEAYFRDGVGKLCYLDEATNGANGERVEYLFEASDIPRLSVALYCLHPQFFFPYYFYPQFYMLQQIFAEFGIFMPPVPPKYDHEARFCYYLELCHSLYDFGQQHGFSGELLSAFLYGFAPEVLQPGHPTITDLPKPERAWFVGGGVNNNGDFAYLDRVTEASQTIWQGNPQTQPGDIVVMYCLSPRSYVHSLWRALRSGAVEPFRFFYHTIWIGHPQLVTPIPLSEMRSDPVLSQMPLVKGNMQGINGRPVKKQFYDRLLSILGTKGMELSALPRLEDVEIGGVALNTERDVEQHLLEPLLAELGFRPNDWIRQLKLRVGRGEKVIPDYVVLPTDRMGGHSMQGAWVWEAKFSIPSHRQLQKDFEQATSYARLVGALGVSLISREGLWLSLKRDEYLLGKARHWSTAQLRSSDHLNEIRDMAGRRRVASSR